MELTAIRGVSGSYVETAVALLAANTDPAATPIFKLEVLVGQILAAGSDTIPLMVFYAVVSASLIVETLSAVAEFQLNPVGATPEGRQVRLEESGSQNGAPDLLADLECDLVDRSFR